MIVGGHESSFTTVHEWAVFMGRCILDSKSHDSTLKYGGMKLNGAVGNFVLKSFTIDYFLPIKLITYRTRIPVLCMGMCYYIFSTPEHH